MSKLEYVELEAWNNILKVRHLVLAQIDLKKIYSIVCGKPLASLRLALFFSLQLEKNSKHKNELPFEFRDQHVPNSTCSTVPGSCIPDFAK